jgi:hypothetical protein
MSNTTRDHGAGHVALLWCLTALFACRVVAQLVQFATPVAALPGFEAWQGGSLSYPVLLASQLAILMIMVRVSSRVSRGVRRVRRVSVWLLAIGSIYFVTMAARLVLGLTVLGHLPWFAKPLPALFHLVLAGFVLTLGHYHLLGHRNA